MPRNQIYCCVCGGPLFEPGAYEHESQDWLTRAVVITTGYKIPGHDGIKLDTFRPDSSCDFPFRDPEHTEPSRVLQFTAEYNERKGFLVDVTGEYAIAMDLHLADGHLYFPLHQACMQVTRCFVASRAVSSDSSLVTLQEGVFSLEQLWEVFLRRMRAGWRSEYILEEPHDYYGGRACRNVYWEPDDGEPEYAQLLQSCPIDLSSLTESILYNLRPEMPDRGQELNVDEADSTRGEMRHDQGWWCGVLAEKRKLPWLWDLDSEIVREKQRNGKWNWELLVRQLSHPGIHEPSDTTLDLPLALRNRRRIWRCLEEARIGDTLVEVDVMKMYVCRQGDEPAHVCT